MISRLTASAAVFAILATAGLAAAADAHHHPVAAQTAAARTVAAEDMPVIVMPRVEVVGHRAAR
jgi:hypothetical protein